MLCESGLKMDRSSFIGLCYYKSYSSAISGQGLSWTCNMEVVATVVEQIQYFISWGTVGIRFDVEPQILQFLTLEVAT